MTEALLTRPAAPVAQAAGIADGRDAHAAGLALAPDVLTVNDLRVVFRTSQGPAEAVRGVDFTLREGETLALVGESGSGKSTLARALTGQSQPPFSRNRVGLSGRAMLARRCGALDLVAATDGERREARAHDIAMISQDALSGLNPVLSVGFQVAESVRVADYRTTRAERRRRAAALLLEVGLPEPEVALSRYPHQFSGGQRQRIMIAMALARAPRLLIADEPTTALDATVQARILELLRMQQQARRMALLFITHDLGVVSRIADRVAVMYAGQIVELTTAQAFRSGPRHPYTAGLLASRPGYGGSYPALAGYAPSPRALPTGCAFRDRCPRALPDCVEPVPVINKDGIALRCRNPL